jgi:hypothetical protein
MNALVLLFIIPLSPSHAQKSLKILPEQPNSCLSALQHPALRWNPQFLPSRSTRLESHLKSAKLALCVALCSCQLT